MPRPAWGTVAPAGRIGVVTVVHLAQPPQVNGLPVLGQVEIQGNQEAVPPAAGDRAWADHTRLALAVCRRDVEERAGAVRDRLPDRPLIPGVPSDELTQDREVLADELLVAGDGIGACQTVPDLAARRSKRRGRGARSDKEPHVSDEHPKRASNRGSPTFRSRRHAPGRLRLAFRPTLRRRPPSPWM